MKVKVGIPKIFWWIRYEISGRYGIFPRAYRSQQQAQDEATKKLGGSYVHYEIHPLETNDVHTAARKLKAMINKSNQTNSNFNAPVSGMRFA
jgi:hypothetical protein